jgi:hypothetical protein
MPGMPVRRGGALFMNLNFFALGRKNVCIFPQDVVQSGASANCANKK